MLYIVSTPIGNLEDITLRALKILKSVDYIAAEDTRRSKILLNHYQISANVKSFHSFSNSAKLEMIIRDLKDGKNIALISDAGTPGISDPGYILIKKAIESDIAVSSIPGPTAFAGALTISGLPMHHFLYLGFLPVKKGRQTLFKKLQKESLTVVFYEAPHRLLRTLRECALYFPDAQIAVARELTKMHEEVFRGSIPEAVDYFTRKGVRGEFTVVLNLLRNRARLLN